MTDSQPKAPNWPKPLQEARRAVEGDLMLLASIELLAQFEATAEQAGWDEPPILLMARRDMMPTEISDQLGGADGLLFQLQQLGPIPIGDSGDEIAARLLTTAVAVASISPDARELVIPDDFFGWVLMHEGWTVHLPPEQLQAAVENRLENHPQRIEVRNVFVCDIAGNTLGIMRERGQDPEQRTVMVDEGSGGYRMGGQLTEALRALLLASTGVSVEQLLDEARAKIDLDGWLVHEGGEESS